MFVLSFFSLSFSPLTIYGTDYIFYYYAEQKFRERFQCNDPNIERIVTNEESLFFSCLFFYLFIYSLPVFELPRVTSIFIHLVNVFPFTHNCISFDFSPPNIFTTRYGCTIMVSSISHLRKPLLRLHVMSIQQFSQTSFLVRDKNWFNLGERYIVWS